MELVKVAISSGRKFAHVATYTSQSVQVVTCTSCNLYGSLVQFATFLQNLNLYITYTKLLKCTLVGDKKGNFSP